MNFRQITETPNALLRLNLFKQDFHMSLTTEQKKELERLSKQLEKIEQIAIENNLDLDVFISEYNEDCYSDHATEQVSLQEKATKRKQVFAADETPAPTQLTNKVK